MTQLKSLKNSESSKSFEDNKRPAQACTSLKAFEKEKLRFGKT
jgi:hypothetical protein